MARLSIICAIIQNVKLQIVKKSFLIFLFIPFFSTCSKKAALPASRQEVAASKKRPSEPELLKVFKESYPDLLFTSQYDEEVNEWKISVELPGEEESISSDFYWCNGSLLPFSELENKDKYWTLLYHYDYKSPLKDPATFTQEEIEALTKFGSNENRQNDRGTPMFFFDFIYSSQNQLSLEKHIVKASFLGKRLNVHERIKFPLKKVEDKILLLSKSDNEVKDFVDGLKSCDAYYWREIANTNRKSFHSLGIALDLLPKRYGGKDVYWSWAKDKSGDKWMLTPLSQRWMPPQKVIEAFEEEGFIWGGKWLIWDNMHFEYHPELINFSRIDSGYRLQQ